MMLNNPYQVSEDSLDGYHHLVAQNSTMVHGFRIAETGASLCLPGRSVSGNDLSERYDHIGPDMDDFFAFITSYPTVMSHRCHCLTVTYSAALLKELGLMLPA
ncbi:hypothetical protein Lal_00033935 [Lupinus albus]|nr:hypothetical protein Lal_00033935 [Lupinus albus]